MEITKVGPELKNFQIITWFTIPRTFQFTRHCLQQRRRRKHVDPNLFQVLLCSNGGTKGELFRSSKILGRKKADRLSEKMGEMITNHNDREEDDKP